MTKISDISWVQKAKKRKAYRDHVRKKFFNELNQKTVKTEQKLTGAPKKQRIQVVRLMNLTRKGDTTLEQEDLLKESAKIFSRYGLGKGYMGFESKNIQKLDRFDISSMRKFFTSSAFFDK